MLHPLLALTETDLLGPLAALALALLGLAAFASGRLLPRNSVPREDYEALRVINASYAEKFGQQTEAIRGLTTTVAKLVAGRRDGAR